MHRTFLFIALTLLAGCSPSMRCIVPEKLAEMCGASTVDQALENKQIKKGSPLFVRIFKEEKMLEMWGLNPQGTGYEPLKAFPICGLSGKLGPKLQKGDKQAPEGFYEIHYGSLKPKSQYYRALNIGYPNEHDLENGCTGNAIMIHGKCDSVGCFAMTDEGIHDIFKHVFACLDDCGVTIPVHIFPFRMEKLEKHKKSPWYGFWKTLLPAYTYFEERQRLPRIKVKDKRYQIFG